jgi:hypothetical protein
MDEGQSFARAVIAARSQRRSGIERLNACMEEGDMSRLCMLLFVYYYGRYIL